MDNGHYHPTEVVFDKISAILAYDKKMALHVTRGVRWDSDHVVLFDDETKEICKEIVRCGGLDRVFIALDYFDASINRISVWVTGFRNLQKALQFALLQPNAELTRLQNERNFSKLMVLQEKMKTMPFGDVWEEYCKVCGKPVDGEWYPEIEEYETLWQMCIEGIVVFPDGVNVLPWMLCGTNEIGEATAEKMKTACLVVWAQHGLYGAGADMDETFGLIETAEKAAEIYLKIAHLPLVNTITDEQMHLLEG